MLLFEEEHLAAAKSFCLVADSIGHTMVHSNLIPTILEHPSYAHYSLSFTHSYTLPITLTHLLSHPLTLALALTHAHPHSYLLSLSLTHSLSHTRPHSHAYSLSLTCSVCVI